MCSLYLPKDWIPDDKFIYVIIDNKMFEGDNIVLRPIEFDEEEVSNKHVQEVISK